MKRIMSATEAKDRFGTLMRWARQSDQGVIIQKRGKSQAVMVSYETFQKLQVAHRKEKRRQAFARLENLAAEVQARNTDLSPEQANQLANRFVRETIEEMAADGTLSFKEPD